MVKAAQDFIPVFIDTLADHKTTRRFQERFGSYPVLRIHGHEGQELGGRINTNLTAGIVPAKDVVEQLKRGLQKFKK